MNELSLAIAPSGRWIFVGRVPAILALECSPAMADVARQVGVRMAKAIAAKRGETVKELSWNSSEEALTYAKARGYTLPQWEPRK